ncbi:MAG: hypothetical protein G01um101438_328 [Parcubacteria group bacterium Gr01-1014_38]|nr:MAG: hypothetical protein G01um101438_328 [Parcubacteria group bacterium Gr01-1014_38]
MPFGAPRSADKKYSWRGTAESRHGALFRTVLVHPDEAGYLWLALQGLAHGPPLGIHRLLHGVVIALSTA